MNRSLSQLGNKSYYVVIPKEWVLKNKLSPQTSLCITDCGKSLVINTTPEQENQKEKCLIKNEKAEEIFEKVLHSYRKGNEELTIVFENKEDPRLLQTEEFAEKLYGTEAITGENSIVISESHDQNMCCKILRKTFQNLLQMSELLTQNPENKTGRKEFFESHERTIFLTEFATRLTNKAGYAEVKKTKETFSMIWSIQCMAELMKRISIYEWEYNKRDIKRLCKALRNAYRGCFEGKECNNIINVFEDKRMINENDNIVCEDVFLIQQICKKLIRFI